MQSISLMLCLLNILSILLVYCDGLAGLALFGVMDDMGDSEEWMLRQRSELEMQTIPFLDPNQTNFSRDSENPVQFFLYTRKNRETYQDLLTSHFNETYFNGEKQTLFLIHAWTHDALKPYIRQLKDVYLDQYDMNIIAVDWSFIASKPYPQARFLIENVADEIASFINRLNDNYIQPLDSIHLWGFSLGVHVAGLTGKKIKGGKIASIIALEPAMPLFSIHRPRKRLDVGDATYVEVIHTAAGTVSFMQPLGHVDFYPNGGRHQPGCENELYGGCSHIIAPDLFKEALKNSTKRAFRCRSFEELARGYCSDSGIYLRMGDLERPVKSQYFGIYWQHLNI